MSVTTLCQQKEIIFLEKCVMLFIYMGCEILLICSVIDKENGIAFLMKFFSEEQEFKSNSQDSSL